MPRYPHAPLLFCAVSSGVGAREALLQLTTANRVDSIGNMRATLLMDERRVLAESRFIEMTVWEVPQPLPGSRHRYKYRPACVVDETCVLRYDNEAGKGDHKHLNEREVPYIFTTLDQMVEDFLADVDRI